jgi:FkbM family methyltransferase
MAMRPQPRVEQSLLRRAKFALSPRRRAERRFYRQFVTRGDLCFDIGAHRGALAALLSHIGGRVVAVEPQAACVADLEQRFARCRSVVIEPCAISDRAGTAELRICSADPMTSMSDEFIAHYGQMPGFRWGDSVSTPTRTLDALVEEYGMPAFCAIDVEGHEPEILQGLSSPIPTIRFEYHQALEKNSTRCIERLSELAEYRFNYSTDEKRGLDIGGWVPAGDMPALLKAAPKNGHVYARTGPSATARHVGV